MLNCSHVLCSPAEHSHVHVSTPVPPSVLPRPHIPDDQISSRCASPCANAVGEDHYSEGLVSSSQLIFLDPPWTWENKPRWHIPVLARGWHSSQKHGFLRLMPGLRAPCRSRVQLEWRKLKIIKRNEKKEKEKDTMTKKKESRQKQSLYSAGIPAVAPVENSVHCATPRWCNSANACKHDAVRARELLVEQIDVIDLRGNLSPDRNFRRKENKEKGKTPRFQTKN